MDPKSSKEKNKKNIKVGCNRFSEEQVKSLEEIFKVEPKLDPRKKVEVAANLGLDPRQVSIWFQNKRARWRSKEIERKYKELRANYNSLHMQFDRLKKENQSLLMQMHELNDLVENLDDEVDLTNEENEFKESSNEGIHDHVNVITKEFEKTEDREFVSCKCNEEEETIMSHLASPQKCDFSCWWEG